MRALLISSGFLLLTLGARAETKPATANGGSVTTYDAILARVTAGQTTIELGDMIVPVETVRLWRDQLAGTAAPGSASQTGITKWTGGNVFYQFNANVSAAHRTATRDAMAEWATFANLTFTESVSANYIMINDVPGLGGGNSSVGMIGGVQQFNIGSTAWNRGTLLHELGHALGLIHEHQRSNRDTFVTIGAAVAGNGNFVLIPTSTNNGAYDFLSVMHYARDLFAPAGVDDITPKPGYTQFIDVMGNNPDRLLSRADRDGIALMYGAGPALGTVVTNTKDAGSGSLRAAIYKAFDLATDTPGATPTISFQIPNTDPNFSGGVFTIRPSDRLTAPGSGTTIDATTQTAFTGDTNASGPEVLLNGALQPSPEFFNPGLRLSAANVTVKGFVINGFSTQAVLITAGATGNTVAGCYIGTNAAGTAAVANTFAGIEISGGATGNVIGGTTAAARNVISGNSAQGVFLRGAGTTGNFVRGNFLGVNATGVGALANGFSGVEIGESASANTVGGTAVGAGNVLSGNTDQGVYLNGVNGNVVSGNLIGTNAAGTAAVANGTPAARSAGVYISGANNVVGTGNVISGNTAQGVVIAGASGNVIAGNFIGTNAAGTASIPNAYSGVGIFSSATGNTVGGTAAGAGNVISGNTNQGVVIANTGTSNNTVLGNWIGLNAAGTAALANAFAGVDISGGAQNNTIGGTTAAARNVISGNANQGVVLSGAGTSGNRISGNYIGTNPAGASAIANGFPGVEIYSGATANTIGGAAPGGGNVISGNSFRGVTINGSGASANIFTGNLIGLNAAGTAALANAGPGILIFGGAQNNEVGATSGGRNFICGNAAQGVLFIGGGTTGNLVRGNSIGIAPSGVTVGNGDQGIALWSDGSGSPQGNTIGGSTPGTANLISGNATAGIAIYDAGTRDNRINGNSIFANNGLGIDLGGNGVTTNDAGDGDTGPNNLQNFPVLTSAVLGTGTTVIGALNSNTSALGTTYRVEFFANQPGLPGGSDEGQTFVGAASVTTNASGAGSFNTVLPAIVPANHLITATATDPAGNTSEFSANVTVTTTDTDGDGLPNAYETANGLSTIVMDAIVDSDGDGMTNAQEFRAGTNPQGGSSILRLGPPVTVGADKTLNLPSLLGRTYRIDFADDLLGANPWRTLADQIPGSGGALTITDPGAAALLRRFYRAVVLP